jgi:hypothetical protein
MSVLAAIMILAANLSDPTEPNVIATTDATEATTILEELMDGELQTDEIVLDETLLLDAESELQEEFEE